MKAITQLRLLAYFLGLLFIYGCQEAQEPNNLLFTDIQFNGFSNQNIENEMMNSFVYEYFYNGAGLSVGDINNDDLLDIYFCSNQGDNKLFLNQGDLKFKDITKESKTSGKDGWSTGTTFIDINNDGLLDLYVCYSGPFIDSDLKRNELYINQGIDDHGVPHFKEEAKKYNLDLSANTNQVAFFDFDNDNDLDVYVLNHNPLRISQDQLDNGRYQSDSLGGDLLMRNDGQQFVDVSKEMNILSNGISYGLGISIEDFNNDGWSDIYVSNDYEEMDYLYLNQNGKHFELQTANAFKHISFYSMGSYSADIDHNGFKDIITLDMMSDDNLGIKTNMSSMDPKKFYEMYEKGRHIQYMYNAVQLNQGTEDNSNIPKFSDVAFLAGMASTDWSWTPIIADFNLDGIQDVYITNGVKRNFRNKDYLAKLQKIMNDPNSIKSYHVWTENMPQLPSKNFMYQGLDAPSFARNHHWINESPGYTHGAVAADLDNDGDLDLIQNNMDTPAKIFKNNATKINKKTPVKCIINGPTRNQFGIGSQIKVFCQNQNYYFSNFASKGYLSSLYTKVLNFSTGEHKIDSIQLTWPDGKISMLQANPSQEYIFEYSNAKLKQQKITSEKIFKSFATDIVHEENDFDDFEIQTLLPYRLSKAGPALCVDRSNETTQSKFFLGGGSSYPGKLFEVESSTNINQIATALLQEDKIFEDVDALFVDINNDGFKDLYVVSGGNEWPSGHKNYNDRLYINNQKGEFSERIIVENSNFSGSVVKASDFDRDGDLDLFIGGRHVPHHYPNPPSSKIYINEKGTLKDHTNSIAPELNEIGMVTDSEWIDYDNDGDLDLIIVGEWMPITILENDENKLKILETNASNYSGLWSSITAHDFDKDGDKDLLIGNWGLNSKYKATEEEEFKIYANDFDANGKQDIVINFFEDGKEYPLRGKQCSSEQIPDLKKKFKTYQSFAESDIREVYGKSKIENSLTLSCNTFSSFYAINDQGTFTFRPLPTEMQAVTINDVLFGNWNNKNKAILIGNNHSTEVETPRLDANYGQIIEYKNGNFQLSYTNHDANLFAGLDAKKIRAIKIKQKDCFLIANNDDSLQLFCPNEK